MSLKITLKGLIRVKYWLYDLTVVDTVSYESKDLKLEVSIYCVGGEEWKLVAEELGLSPREIRYIDK